MSIGAMKKTLHNLKENQVQKMLENIFAYPQNLGGQQ